MRSLTRYLVTIAAGELPLEPRITPGFSVAGVILIMTGTAYTLIGIKTRWLHCFLSAGYLGAIGVTVLIVYVMNPPISDGVQGAYVVAATGTGLLLGGAALVFKEVTECLACVLGGFCLAMWLLTLKEGGLLGAGGAGVTILIGVLAAAAFAGYFSRWTRAHFMITCISLSGATAVVIGIDCFSRAGLKEYWAWIWNINDKLFPFGADTYPLTRGIKVEQAATIIIALIGLVSQHKLWLVVKEHRARKEEERIRAEAENQVHEANVGRDVEMAHASERKQWEAVYGGKSGMGVHASEDSGVGDIYQERKLRTSGTTTTATGTRRSTIDEREEIEMAEIPIAEDERPGDAVTEVPGDQPDLPPKPKTAAEKVLDRSADGMVTVRVAADDVTLGSPTSEKEQEEKVWLFGDDGEARLVPKASTEFRPKASTPSPNLVSLPFRVPAEAAETGAGGDDDQSSVAAIADHDGDLLETRSTASKRSSLANRLSVGSADLFRRLSQRSLGRKIDTAGRGKSDSREDLTSPVKEDDESVAATLDESDGCSVRAVTPTGERPLSKEIKAELADEGPQEKAPAKRPASEVTVPTNILDSPATDPDSTRSPGAKSKPSLGSMLTSEKANTNKLEDALPVEDESVSKAGKSIASETDSGPVSLTKDRLPRGLSKIALSYRTNEWAKHLSNAEMPSPAELRIPHEPEPELTEVKEVEEKVAPVNVDELKKTALDATPPPAMPRSVSAMSVQLPTPQGYLSPSQRVYSETRRTSGRPVPAVEEEDDNRSIMSSDSRKAARSAAAAALTGDVVSGPPIMPRSGNMAAAATHVSSRPPVPGLVSYDSPQTLIGQRDLLMRKKASVLRPDSVQPGKVSPPSSISASESSSVRGGPPAALYGTVAALGPPAMRNPDASGSAPNSRRTSGTAGISGSAFVDADDLPLSQRKTMMRQDSRTSVNSGSLVGGANFNSHQPQRMSNIPSQAVRESQLAGFRQSIQQDLRSTSSGHPAVNANAQLGYGGGFNNGMQPGPLINSIYGVPGTSSANSLPQHVVRQSYDAEVQRDIDTQRSFMMGQRQAEAQKQATLKSERERAGRMFEQRIRSDHDMMEMHRKAMRKMQKRASQADRQMH
jgi:hypothetical protein